MLSIFSSNDGLFDSTEFWKWGEMCLKQNSPNLKTKLLNKWHPLFLRLPTGWRMIPPVCIMVSVLGWEWPISYILDRNSPAMRLCSQWVTRCAGWSERRTGAAGSHHQSLTSRSWVTAKGPSSPSPSSSLCVCVSPALLSHNSPAPWLIYPLPRGSGACSLNLAGRLKY